MATLTSMTQFVRDRIHADETVFTDSAIEAALTRTQRSLRAHRLDPVPDPWDSSAPVFFRSTHRDWDSAIVLYDADGTDITSTATVLADVDAGEWEFATAPTDPVYLRGVWYNPFAAAVALLTDWVARYKLQYATSVGGIQHARDQISERIYQVKLELMQRMPANEPKEVFELP